MEKGTKYSNPYFEIIESYIQDVDEISRNNANFVKSLATLETSIVGAVSKDYLFDVIYEGLPIRPLHDYGWIYHHQTFKLSPYCIGLSAKSIAFHGLRSNAKNDKIAKPPKRLDTLFMQCANLICLVSQEVSGATSLNDISVVAAGYLYVEEEINKTKKYTDYELKNIWQNFLYNINLPFRAGNSPFSNITLDFGKPPYNLKDEPVIFAGKPLDFTYKDIPSEFYDRINKAFIDAMDEGDGLGNPFTFPLITVNVDEEFDYDNPVWKYFLQKVQKFGGFYIQNYYQKPFIDTPYKEKNPYIKPLDKGTIYSNCCFTGDMCIVDAETSKPVSFEQLLQLKQSGKPLPKVIAYDEKKKKFVVSTIKEVAITRYVDELCEVELDNEFVITCTPDHPFLTKSGWKYAEKLESGEPLVCLEEENEKCKVKSVRKIKLDKQIPVYDIEVDKYHNFLLWIGNSSEKTTVGVIVHNCRMMFSTSLINSLGLSDNQTSETLDSTKVGSHVFGAMSGVGGIGVININLARLIWLSGGSTRDLFKALDYLFEVAQKALQRKREWIRKHYADLYPYLSFYQPSDKTLYNIFSVVGVHEGLQAYYKGGIYNPKGREIAHKIAQWIAKKIEHMMNRDKVLCNLEYAPSENAAPRMAKYDLIFANELARAIENGEDPITKLSDTFLKDDFIREWTKQMLNKHFDKLFRKVKA